MLAECPRVLPSPQRESEFARPLHSTWSASLRCERYDLVRYRWRRNRWQPFFFGRLRTRKSYGALWLTLPSYRSPLHVTPDSERMRSSSASWQRLSMSSGSNGLRGGAISQQAGRVFLTGHFQAPRQCSFPFYRSSYEPNIVARPPLVSYLSFCFSCSHIWWWH